MLEFTDFQKLDIKIGTVVKAERIQGTDRLLKVIIDVGSETRQVVAGFGHKLGPEDIKGKQVPVVLNIKEAKIRGVKSQGIFVAIDSSQPVLLVSEKKVANGSKVK